MRGKVTLGFLFAALISALFWPRSLSAGPTVIEREGQLAGYNYHEFIVGEAKPNDTLPLVIALHAWGGTPRGMGRVFRSDFNCPARIVLPAGPIGYGTGFAWLNAHAVNKESILSSELKRAAENFSPFIGHSKNTLPTSGAPIVTGFSQGGIMTFALAALHPEKMKVAVPVAGLLPKSLWPKANSKKFPRIVAIHGERDAHVPFARTRRAISHLKGLGLNATLHPFAKTGHTFSRKMKNEMRRTISQAIKEQGGCPSP